MKLELVPVGLPDVAAMREERLRGSSLRIVPLFYAHLAAEAEPFIVMGRPDSGPAGPAEERLGYALLLSRKHAGHGHVTVIELFLKPQYHESYEDALDLLKQAQRPMAYLVRTDDCALTAALLSRGLQVEPTALVMVPGTPGSSARPDGAGAQRLRLAKLGPKHMPVLRELLAAHSPPPPDSKSKDTHQAPSHRRGHRPELSPDAAERLAELETLAGEGRHWVALKERKPVAVLARADGGDGEHELIDFALAHAGEAELVAAVLLVCDEVRSAGKVPAAVIEATETARRRFFREAGFYSEAAYVIFYDVEAGRPSVAVVSLEDLIAARDRSEKFRLVDVLGEAHWNAGHISASEWIDFRGLAREAKRRFALDEPIIVYCDGFT